MSERSPAAAPSAPSDWDGEDARPEPPPHEYRLGFRSDVEGLRGVGILLVVAAHAGITFLDGGFIGVDVFFVLSGYLITGLLVQEIGRTGRIKFGAFYARRFRRLLPALLMMLVFTSLLGNVLLAPGEHPGQAITAASAALWISNLRFTFSELDYFSPGVESNLFLHTWSLGVEEQFYLFWPALTVLTMGLVKASSGRRKLGGLRIAMVAIFAVSLTACLRLTESAPQAAFYLMPTRAWQFALGALVFISFGSPAEAPIGRTGRRVHLKGSTAPLRALMGWLGIALVVGSAVYLDGAMPYPGALALLPSMGTAMVIASGVDGKTGVGRILSLAPMQALGRFSYSWYLWHWPILLLGATFTALSGSWAFRVGIVALSLAVAAASYEFLEAPIRRDPRWLARPGVTIVASIGAMAVVGGSALAWQGIALNRLEQPDLSRAESVRADIPTIYQEGCDDFYRSDRIRVCAFGPETAEHTAVAIGDSIGMQWFPAMEETFTRPGWRLLVLTKSSCPMVDEPYFLDRIGREFTECASWRKEVLRRLRVLSPDVVILGSSVNYGFSKSQWVEGTARILKEIPGSVRSISILRSTPVLAFDGPSCLATSRSGLQKHVSSASHCASPAEDERAESVLRWLREAARRFPRAAVVDMNDIVCPNDLCRAEKDGIIVFRDRSHLTATYVRSISNLFAARVRRGAL